MGTPATGFTGVTPRTTDCCFVAAPSFLCPCWGLITRPARTSRQREILSHVLKDALEVRFQRVTQHFSLVRRSHRLRGRAPGSFKCNFQYEALAVAGTEVAGIHDATSKRTGRAVTLDSGNPADSRKRHIHGEIRKNMEDSVHS